MMFLTDDELVALTGYKRPAAQVRALRSMGIEHKVRPDNTVAVLSAHVSEVMGAKNGGGRTRIEPNWNAMNA